MTQFVVWLNSLANVLGRALIPIAWLPGWLSATIVAALTGIVMLLSFKYTSNQRGIKRVRDDIKANLLALSLFKDNMAVSLRAQLRILIAAMRLLVLAFIPMLVMLIPMCLILGQMSLWYQLRPLKVGEEAVLSLKLRNHGELAMPKVTLQPISAVETTVGPVQIESDRTICWNIVPREAGYHQLVFDINGQSATKDLTAGDGFRRVSAKRPIWDWSEALLYPWEAPYQTNHVVESITIDYPTRSSWTSGSDTWVIYWFAASMVAALLCRRMFNVNL